MMNNLLDKKTYYNILFNFYGKLLTEKQQELFKAYYEDDYSLQEIAEEFNISRNAVHDALKNAIKNLEHFEENLQLATKYDKYNELLEKYQNIPECSNLIKELKEME